MLGSPFKEIKVCVHSNVFALCSHSCGYVRSVKSLHLLDYGVCNWWYSWPQFFQILPRLSRMLQVWSLIYCESRPWISEVFQISSVFSAVWVNIKKVFVLILNPWFLLWLANVEIIICRHVFWVEQARWSSWPTMMPSYCTDTTFISEVIFQSPRTNCQVVSYSAWLLSMLVYFFGTRAWREGIIADRHTSQSSK